ncbi:hypothetical protein KP509_37G040600 [Ceratopteris richardii]|uniref:Uncharacterized protein n=1 Tax=Ceratopteris richardii TaxID=49495 RepID=A0A8T2Q7U5_CERRI|nr:hypothetical protein KP509_37G040600 [Ceratopteris richardii]
MASPAPPQENTPVAPTQEDIPTTPSVPAEVTPTLPAAAEDIVKSISLDASVVEESAVLTVEDASDCPPPPSDSGPEPQPEDRAEPPPEAEAEEAAVEESFYIKDLKPAEKKALLQLKAKIKASIEDNSFLDISKPVKPKSEESPRPDDNKEHEEKVNQTEGEAGSHDQEPQPTISAAEDSASRDVQVDSEKTDETSAKDIKPEVATEEAKPALIDVQEDTAIKEGAEVCSRDVAVESLPVIEEQSAQETPVEEPPLEDLALWGIPLLHSKGDEKTDVLLLKFLRARDLKVDRALNMLQETITWRKEFNADVLAEEEAPVEFEDSFIHGVDREGHPVFYNREFSSKKGVDDEAQLKRRIQVLEKGIQKLDFSPTGVHSMLQVMDFAGHSPSFLSRGLKLKILDLLQDNYPELVAKQIYMNVPWYVPPMLSLFNRRTRSKVVIAKPGRVTETLFKYITPDQVPVQYGGLSRLNDVEFAGIEAPVTQIILKAGEKRSIELPVEKVGRVVWDIAVVGWDVLYSEEFVPDEGYTKIVRKVGKVAPNEEPCRNSYVTDELGKVILTIDNTASRKRRAIAYRYTVHAP